MNITESYEEHYTLQERDSIMLSSYPIGFKLSNENTPQADWILDHILDNAKPMYDITEINDIATWLAE